MTTATTETTEAPDLDQLERDARAQIGELEQQESRLALDALTDPALAEELRAIQSERAAAEAQVRQAVMAREEIARREVQAVEEEEAARRAEALGEARKLQPTREAAAALVDETAATFARALSAWAAVKLEQEIALDGAHERALRPAPSACEAALVAAMADADCPRGIIDFGGIHARPRPLVESDPSQPVGER